MSTLTTTPQAPGLPQGYDPATGTIAAGGSGQVPPIPTAPPQAAPASVDYDALAAKNGAVSATADQTPTPDNGVDYDALAEKNGAVSASAAQAPSGKPGFLESALAEAKKLTVGAVKSSVPDPTNAKEDIVYGIGGPAALVTYRKIAHLSDSLNSAIGGKVQNYQDLKKDVAQTLIDIHQGNFGEGAASATSSLADAGGLTGLLPVGADRIRATAEATKPGGNLAGELGTDTTDATAAAGMIAAGEIVPELGGEEAEVPEAEEAAPDTSSMIQKGKDLYAAAKQVPNQIIKGADVAQPPAQATIRAAAQASAEDAGVAPAASVSSQPIRTLLDEPISALAKTERAAYDTLNKAAGTDLKSLYDYADELQDNLDDPSNIANRPALEKELKTTQDAIAKGETQATKNGVNPDTLDQAKAMTQQRYSMQAAKQKIFNNETVVKGNEKFGASEEINTEAAIRNAENLNKPSRYAPEGSPTRLQQAFGEKGANDLLQGLYDAQKAGQLAVKVRKVAGWLGGGIVTGAGAYHELSK